MEYGGGEGVGVVDAGGGENRIRKDDRVGDLVVLALYDPRDV